MEHPNVQRLREAYAAFARGDLETIGRELAPDAVWHVAGQSDLAGDYKGQDEIFGFFGKLFELSGGTLRIDVDDILANDEHATAIVRMSAQRGDDVLSMNGVHVYRLEEGKTKEFWSFDEDQRREDAFWS